MFHCENCRKSYRENFLQKDLLVGTVAVSFRNFYRGGGFSEIVFLCPECVTLMCSELYDRVRGIEGSDTVFSKKRVLKR
jgi:hypothetical protein